MSPVSRQRKKAKSRSSGQRVVRVIQPEDAGECDCPACRGAEIDPAELVDALVEGAGELFAVADPVEAELFGATLVASGGPALDGLDEALAEGIVPALEERGSPEALTTLLAIEAVTGNAATSAAVRRLTGDGVAAPAWVAELAEPLEAGLCLRFSDPSGAGSVLVCSFTRAGRTHGFVVNVDHLDCDAASDVVLVPGEVVAEVAEQIRADARRTGLTMVDEVLAPGEFRWQVERALNALAVHDSEDGEPPVADEEETAFQAAAVLLRARLGVWGELSRPLPEHGAGDLSEQITAIAADEVRRAEAYGERARIGKLPAKRKKSDGPAPIFQVKADLVGAKPPIWRRLELPADISLAELHRSLQVAFEWDDYHLHVFDTAYGEFGLADKEQDIRAEKPVTLEQVAPEPGERLLYTYDFGDAWEVDVTVEKIVERRPGSYPRCTGGRRAAPPEDCGGIWGYADLLEVLADPQDPEHGERLEWLGLTSASEFDPDGFDAAELTRRLGG